MNPLVILGLLEGILSLLPKAQAVAEEMKRTGEWTDAEWEAWKTKKDALVNSAAWAPDIEE